MWRPEASARVDPGFPHEDEVRLQPADFLKAATTPLRTQIPMIATLGRPIALPAEVAAEAFFAIVLVGFGILLAALSRGRDPPGGRRLWAPIAACAVMYLLGIVLCLALWKGFPGQYYIIGAWAWPLVCAALVDAVERPGLRAGWTTALVLAGLASGTLHVSGNSRENMRGAVGTAVEAGEPIGAIYTAVLWQPLWYPHALPFQVYAPGVATCEPGEVPPAIGGERRPVVVVTRDVAVKGDRSMPGAWGTIRKGRHIVRDLWVDQTIRVVVFEAD
jgi:hypothetical protein